MTESSKAGSISLPKAHVAKLIILLGASALLYQGALGPVLKAVRGIYAQDAKRSRLVHELVSMETANRHSAAKLQSTEKKLQRDLKAEQTLRRKIAAAQALPPPSAPVSSVSTSVPLPTVNTTTGASGMP